MPAERKPREDRSFLSRMLFWLTRFSLRESRWVIVGALGLSVAAIVFAVLSLNFHTSRLDLLNPESKYNQRWLDYIDEFGQQDDVIVVVETGDEKSSIALIEKLGKRLAANTEQFRSVVYKRDLSKIREKGLHFAKPSEVKEASDFVQWVQHSFGDSGVGIDSLLSAPSAGRANDAEATEASATLEKIAENLHYALNGEDQYRPIFGSNVESYQSDVDLQPTYFQVEDGRLTLLLLRINGGSDSFTGGTEAIDALRNELQVVQDENPGASIGATGMPVLENDEMRSSQDDMMRASLLSLIGVAVLFIAGFGGVRRPAVTIISLLIAIAWSFGYITLAVGHLNILSVSFGVILIGLGIDFGIHYIARYQQLRRDGIGVSRSLLRTASSVGPGIVTGAVTTALAFLTAGLTNFPGIAELGIISGGGILLCLVSSLFVLPAMVRITDRGTQKQKPVAALPIGQVCEWFIRYPKRTLALGVIGTILLAVGVPRLRIDHNLLNLQATGLQSVELERTILSKSNRSVWFALSMADSPAELLRRKELFEALPTVDRTEEIASLTTVENPERVRKLKALNLQLRTLVASLGTETTGSATALAQKLSFTAQRLPEKSDARLALTKIVAELTAASPDTAAKAIETVQNQMAAELLIRLRELAELSNPEPPHLDDLPQSLRDRFVGKTGKHLLRVYSRGEIWEMDKLTAFVKDVEGVDPMITGHPIQTFYSTGQMQESYLHAALYSLIAVTVVLMIDFGSLRHSILALAPMGLGFLQMLGIMGFLDIPLNPANMLVLPLILGIGIDDGVHVIHDYRRQRSNYRLGDSTASAVIITSLTTMVGFGMMIFANHQGLRSLGQVLTIGVFCCMTTSVVILPALLAWRTGNTPAADDVPPDADSDASAEDGEADETRLLRKVVVRSQPSDAV